MQCTYCIWQIMDTKFEFATQYNQDFIISIEEDDIGYKLSIIKAEMTGSRRIEYDTMCELRGRNLVKLILDATDKIRKNSELWNTIPY